MFGENFMIIIKDGSDREVMNEITGVIDMLLNRRYGKTISRMVDEDKPDMKVFVIRTTFKKFFTMKEIIETKYPNYCEFKHV